MSILSPQPQAERDGYDGIQLVRSEDGGVLWSEPQRVDPCRTDGGAYTRTPSIAVSPSGVVSLSWYDRADDPERKCQKILFTASIDGGETFMDPVKVPTAASCPDTERNGFAARRWSAGGDSSGLTSAADGRFHVVWADSRSGVYGLRTAVVEVNPAEETPKP